MDLRKKALETSLAAGVNLADTAAMYSGGAAERRLGEFAHDRDVVIASRSLARLSCRAEDFPKELEEGLTRLGRNCIDLYQHHFPSNRVSIPRLMEQVVHAVEVGKVKAVGVSNDSAEQMWEVHAALGKRGVPKEGIR